MLDDTENLMIDVTFKFAPGIIEYCEKLESERKFVSARKLLKSGTSIGANSRETHRK
jgi:four helix bundle protein